MFQVRLSKFYRYNGNSATRENLERLVRCHFQTFTGEAKSFTTVGGQSQNLL